MILGTAIAVAFTVWVNRTCNEINTQLLAPVVFVDFWCVITKAAIETV
jgi:hypothetical protein